MERAGKAGDGAGSELCQEKAWEAPCEHCHELSWLERLRRAG